MLWKISPRAKGRTRGSVLRHVDAASIASDARAKGGRWMRAVKSRALPSATKLAARDMNHRARGSFQDVLGLDRRNNRHSYQSRALSAAMPTIMISGPYRFFFYAGDRNEPPHVHVERDDLVAKFWLRPPVVQHNGGMCRTEIARIGKLVIHHLDSLLEAWNDH